MPAIEIAGLERRYGDRVAISDLSFQLLERQTLVLLGANGAGKTTLLRVLATLLRPHAGEVRVLGAKLPAEAWKVRGRIGYVAHEPLLYRSLSARENLEFNARLHRVDNGRVGELLEQVGLGRRADDPVDELSRGMCQRASVARALLHDPELLLLDEPYTGLDARAHETLEPLIGRSSGRTRVVATHDPSTEGDQVLRLQGGLGA